MPLATLSATAEKGTVTRATAADDPTPDLAALQVAGIDLAGVANQLLCQGIDTFMVPTQSLLDGIESKSKALLEQR
jgi:hypothetical protein